MFGVVVYNIGVIKLLTKVFNMYDFDSISDRYAGCSKKWHKYPNKDVIPLWVADMDFIAAPEIKASLERVLEHNIYGYSTFQDVVQNDVVKYLADKYQWQINSRDIMFLPGMVAGINLACRALTSAGDSVLTATPIYPPFMSAPKLADRGLVTIALEVKDDKWQWDFTKLEQTIADSLGAIKLILLCNPHNPVGRVWNREELLQILAIAIKYDLYVCSDEIHCGLILDEECPHIPFASLSEDAAMRTVTLMAPSKTFNLAGLNCAYAIAANPNIRSKFAKIMTGLFSSLNIFGLVACHAALTKGADWHSELITYLNHNADLVCDRVSKWDGFKVIRPEATYLAWIDGREFIAKHGIENLQKFFEQHGAGLSDGAEFGLAGFVRLNFATQRAILSEGLARMEQAISRL